MKKNDTALNILVPGKLYSNAKTAADNRNISLAALVRMALTEWLSSNGETIDKMNADEIFAAMQGEIIQGR
jgi:hypothetical protein